MTGTAAWAAWGIFTLATAGVILRPFKRPEWIWAVTGAILVVVLDVLPASAALTGVRRGTDVYLFLTGMMLLAELARQTELFGWLAARSAGFARGSATRLFTLIYAVGTLVTVFLSNDATAVVLTPAVAAVARAVKAEQSLPYLLICAFVANAASFVLPISNPANLVLYGTRLPPLVQWVQLYALPSLLAILSTYVILRWTQRRDLRLGIAADIEVPTPSPGAKMAGLGIGASAVVLLVASASGQPLGMPTLAVGVATALAVLARSRADPRAVIAGVSWGVLPLVAGLFVLVEAIERTGAMQQLGLSVREAARVAPFGMTWISGFALAFGSNLLNNLPAGLLAARVTDMADLPGRITQAAVIGIDLGPNLSVTGSLATILWLTALRREGVSIGAWAFLRLGAVIMPPALMLALAGLFAFG